MHSIYYDREAMRGIVRDGRHREIVGGMWDELGRLQMGALQAHGMRPHHRLLDIGCGIRQQHGRLRRARAVAPRSLVLRVERRRCRRTR